MRACDITKILCKSLACGLGLTAVGTGVVITFNNIIHFDPNRTPPANSTLKSCMTDWDLENHDEALAVLYSLITLAPATLLSIVYFYYQLIKNHNYEETTSLLVRAENNPEIQLSKGAKIGIGLLQGLLVVLFVLGIFGGLVVSNQKDDAKDFEKNYPNASTEQCYNEWNRLNTATFSANIGVLVPIFLVAAIVSIIGMFKESSTIQIDDTATVSPSL